MAYKYYKSDFALVVNIGAKYTDDDGNPHPITAETPFVFRLYTPKTGSVDYCYEAYSKGQDKKNCSVLNSTQILIYVDHSQHEFETGELMLEVEFLIDNVNYEGDSTNNVMRLYNTGVVLTDKPDLDTEGTMNTTIFETAIFLEVERLVNEEIQGIKNILYNLPDGQAVTMQVARNMEKIELLDTELIELTNIFAAEKTDDTEVNVSNFD